jgi:hypothetical protein
MDVVVDLPTIRTTADALVGRRDTVLHETD